jgi:uncharacterized membrane protein YphA (DoxX/SURF4 family)
MSNTVAVKSFPIRTIGLWVLRVLVAALFLFAAFMKLSSQPMMVEEFGVVGLGQWFRFFTGALELVGAIAVLTPAVSGLGALLLLCVDIGAFVAQITMIHQDWVHTIVIGAVIALLAYLQRDQIRSRIGL